MNDDTGQGVPTPDRQSTWSASLSDILRDPLRRNWQPPSIMESPKATIRAAREIRKRWPEIEPKVREEDAERIARDMAKRLSNDDWTDCFWSDVRRSARALFGHDLWQRQEFSALRRMLLNLIRPDRNRSYLRTMYLIYLESWDPRSELTVELARRLSIAWKAGLSNLEPILDVCELFNVKEASRDMAVFLSQNHLPYEAVRALGIRQPHGTGFMQAAHVRFVENARTVLAAGNEHAVRQMLDWITPEGAGAMRDGAHLAINALLEPWNDREPSEEFRKMIEARLIDAYGDPRTQKTGVWLACSRLSLSVILRWLTERTLLAFFSIIDRVEPSHMWHDRRIYWTERFKRGSIQEAWVVLNARGQREAAALQREHPELRLGRTGRNDSGSSDQNKCFLIMLDSGLRVIEGSHNYKVHVFKPDIPQQVEPRPIRFDAQGPRILKLKYPQHVAQIIHTQGSWQWKVTDQIAAWKQ